MLQSDFLPVALSCAPIVGGLGLGSCWDLCLLRVLTSRLVASNHVTCALQIVVLLVVLNVFLCIPVEARFSPRDGVIHGSLIVSIIEFGVPQAALVFALDSSATFGFIQDLRDVAGASVLESQLSGLPTGCSLNLLLPQLKV